MINLNYPESHPVRESRESTKRARAQAHANPRLSKVRKILPEDVTASVKATSTSRKVDGAISALKAVLRIHTYFINAWIEITYQTPLNRGKTALQGTRASKGYQAAHASLAPNTRDDFTLKVMNRVVEVGVTPTKTGPFLEQRLSLSSSELKQLSEGHQDENFVSTFILNRLPEDGEHSVLSGTRYSWNCNATFENPDESNQYDTRLEKSIAPFLKGLQELRIAGKDKPEDSTEKLVTWLVDYYKQSVCNLKNKIENLKEASVLFDEMRAFELYPTEEDFAAYLENVEAFLKCYDALQEKKVGCPSCKDLKFMRPDWSFLRKLNSSENPTEFYLKNGRHLSKEMTFSFDEHLEKFDLYLQEAEAQMDGIEAFTDPCTIPHLSTALFGVVENGVRRAPTEEEFKEQIFALSSPATPVKAKVAKRLNFNQNL
jgi:hypothetical protein